MSIESMSDAEIREEAEAYANSVRGMVKQVDGMSYFISNYVQEAFRESGVNSRSKAGSKNLIVEAYIEYKKLSPSVRQSWQNEFVTSNLYIA